MPVDAESSSADGYFGVYNQIERGHKLKYIIKDSDGLLSYW